MMIKTKYTNPYDYDPIMQFISEEIGIDLSDYHTIYSDRLLHWDSAKLAELTKKHFGNESHYWDHRSPESIQAFLRDWTGKAELVLAQVQELCNPATGYPYWKFDYFLKGA
jgi:hypothetical protein